MESKRIKLESDLANLSKAREFIAEAARGAGATSQEITKIEISCDEWSANIIEHGLGSKIKRSFSIECKSPEGKFVIIYENEGPRFNPIEQEVIDVNDHFSESKERGLGIYIMREMMDEIHYEYINNKINRLTIVKYLGEK
ncbi:MAG: ATP-binding protein [Spirochaetota bacterium]|nr:MAG: ATP-binding protein [Spirochaetota bacterium]